ncbi:MAG: BMP family ABC transporter substrate-binding protein [Lachnospiraceae bacterium]|nr:BMP family ABC transporter substrate-binding protein [Lachnospiraceae bacterium]
MQEIKKRNFFLGILSAAILLLIFLFIVLFGNINREENVKIGFIMSGSKEETGWNGRHYQGIKEACEAFDAELLVKENIKEYTGLCEQAIHELAEEGAGMIILSSYSYSEEVKDLVKAYPGITFYAISSEYHSDNMTSYFARMYQARYLAGIIAGLKTESGVIGYVAAMPNYEVNRGINAFTLGVKRVNKDAGVVVTWTDTWDDEAAEREAAGRLIGEMQADVLTYHQNQNHVIRAAEEAGVFSIGFHQSFEGFSPLYLTSAVYDWNLVYKELVREFMRGEENSRNNYWVGIETGAVALSEYSSEVSDEIRAEVEKAKAEMLSGRDVFSGVIYDNEGNLQCDESEMISDEMLLEGFDWYVEGVEFYE